MNNDKIRLHKYISDAGYTSRRNAEKLISEGRVKVNNKIISKQGVLVSKKDTILIDNEMIKDNNKKIYILLNKPEGYVCSMKDQFDRKLAGDLLKGVKARVYPVGRLDYNSSGLIIMTNDGEFANKISHPSSGIDKEYIVKINGTLTNDQIKKILDGIKIDDYTASVKEFSILSQNPKNSYVSIVLTEGKNKEIRRIFEILRMDVLKLKRVRIGPITIEDLKKGDYRYLSAVEIDRLMKCVL